MSTVELWVEARDGRPAVNPVVREMLDALVRLGHDVDVVVPDERPVVPTGETRAAAPDLVLLKSTTPAALSAAAVAEASGVRFLNRAAASIAVSDKAFALARLAAAGVPVPHTLLAADGVPVPAGAPAVDDPGPRSPGGWVRKPAHGVHGWGVSFHPGLQDALRSATDTAAAPAGTAPGSVLLQGRAGDDAPDVKVYAVGERVFAGRKPFSRSSFASDDVEPVSLHPDEHAAVVAAGRACGLRVFGVDLRRGPGDDPTTSTVVDVNAWPGFRGFPTAVPVLLDEVLGALREPR